MEELITLLEKEIDRIELLDEDDYHEGEVDGLLIAIKMIEEVK